MKVVFSAAAYAALLVETQEKIRTETGGVFLGAFRDDTWYIVETIDPGPHSIFRTDYFEYDQPYTAHLINKRARLYKANLTLVGLWHRHPGSFDIFSTTDDGTNAKYASLSPNGAVSMLVNIDPVFRLSVFHVAAGRPGRPEYTLISYEVNDESIPPEFLEKKGIIDLQNSIDHTGLRAMGLYSYLRNVVKQLDKVPPMNEETEGSNIVYLHAQQEESDEQILKDKLIDLVVEHISYLSDTVRFNISANWKERDLEICEVVRDGKQPVFSFRYLLEYDCAGLDFEGELYFCKPDMFHSETLIIAPNGTMRRSSGMTYAPKASPAQTEETPDTIDIEQIYIRIRNGVYRFFSNLLDNGNEKG